MKALAALGLIVVLVGSTSHAQQPLTIEGVTVLGDYDSPQSCYVFVPVNRPDTIRPVVFLHGYGALNPVNYGAWLREILAQGHPVIYPRYQVNLLRPAPKKFVNNAVAGIQEGLSLLTALDEPVAPSIVYIGHSYGGTIAANLLASSQKLNLPAPYGALLAAPGTGRFRGARLESYDSIAPNTQIAIVTHANDIIVGDELARLIGSTVGDDTSVLYVTQKARTHDTLQLRAGHNECYAVDLAFDTGLRNYTTRKGLRVGKIDANDRDLYWPLTSALLEGYAARRTVAWPLTEEGLDYGTWPDGTTRAALEVSFSQQGSKRSSTTEAISKMDAHVQPAPAAGREIE